jgi:preprotein translocase subunit SecB
MSIFLIQQPQDELDAVREFQQHAELIRVRMKRFCAKSAEKEPEIKKGLQLDLKHQATRAEVIEGQAQFDIELDMSAYGDKDPRKLLFHVDCCFELQYALAPGFVPTSDAMTAFKKGNAVFHCWPYVREFVQNATQRMGLMVPPIPLLRLHPLSARRRVARRSPRPGRSLSPDGPVTGRLANDFSSDRTQMRNGAEPEGVQSRT